MSNCEGASQHTGGVPRDRGAAGWAADGANLDGTVLNNIKILFEGPPDARVLLDDCEITE